MNHDPFEDRLRALQRRELPPEWRSEILGAAATAARPRPLRAPRWLVTGWSVAWAAILLLYFTTPPGPDTQAAPAAQAQDVPSLQWEQRFAAIEDLLAAN